MGEIDDAPADTAFGKQLAGKDEQRHRDQDEGFDAADVGKENRFQRMAEIGYQDEADGGASRA